MKQKPCKNCEKLKRESGIIFYYLLGIFAIMLVFAAIAFSDLYQINNLEKNSISLQKGETLIPQCVSQGNWMNYTWIKDGKVIAYGFLVPNKTDIDWMENNIAGSKVIMNYEQQNCQNYSCAKDGWEANSKEYDHGLSDCLPYYKSLIGVECLSKLPFGTKEFDNAFHKIVEHDKICTKKIYETRIA